MHTQLMLTPSLPEGIKDFRRIAEDALDHDLCSIQVHLDKNFSYGELLKATESLSKDPHDWGRAATEYAAHHCFYVSGLRGLELRTNWDRAHKASAALVYEAVRVKWPALAPYCPVFAWDDVRRPFLPSVDRHVENLKRLAAEAA